MKSWLAYSTYEENALVWCDDEDGEGAFVGQEFDFAKSTEQIRTKLVEIEDQFAKMSSKDDSFDYLTVEIAVAKFALTLSSDRYSVKYGWNFETGSLAKQAMGVAKAAIKTAKSDKPYPEWATTALANGWKAPKGWKP